MSNAKCTPCMALVASVAAAATVSLLWTAWQKKSNDDKNKRISNEYDVPSDFLSDDCKYKEEMKLAVILAIQAGDNIFSHCNTKGTIRSTTFQSSTSKSNEKDLTTEIDLKNEQLVTESILKTFPSHKIIGEESTGVGPLDALSTHVPTWIIDPIDGTANFASGFPLCCVSIGLCDEDGVPVMGVVYSPNTNELYTAIRGKGAYRNGARISVRDDDHRSKAVKQSIICFELGFVMKHDHIDIMLDAIKRLLYHGCRAVRSTGSGVLDLCYVATGRMDAVYTGLTTEGWKPWDYCAGMVIVEEAGAVIRHLVKEGGFDIYSKDMICAVNESLLKECRKLVLGK